MSTYPLAQIIRNIRTVVAAALPANTPGYLLKDPRQIKSAHPLAFTIVPQTPPDNRTTTYFDSNELGYVSQEERWHWIVYLLIGLNENEEDELVDEIDLRMSAIQEALTGYEPEPSAGEIERLSAGYYGYLPNGQVWGFEFWHDRNTGEEP